MKKRQIEKLELTTARFAKLIGELISKEIPYSRIDRRSTTTGSAYLRIEFEDHPPFNVTVTKARK